MLIKPVTISIIGSIPTISAIQFYESLEIGWAICCLLLISFDLLIYLVRQLEPVPCILIERTLYLIGRGFLLYIRVC